MGMKEDGPKRPNKKLLYYYGIILLITILLNALVMPALAERSVTESGRRTAPYSDGSGS